MVHLEQHHAGGMDSLRVGNTDGELQSAGKSREGKGDLPVSAEYSVCAEPDGEYEQHIADGDFAVTR